MKTVTIVRGQWSAKGNYTGWTISGAQYFIHGKMLAALGITPDTKDVPLIYAFVATKTFDVLGEDGKPVEVNGVVQTFERDQATAIFTSMDKLIEAKNSEAVIEILARKALRKHAEEAEMTMEQVNALVTASLR